MVLNIKVKIKITGHLFKQAAEIYLKSIAVVGYIFSRYYSTAGRRTVLGISGEIMGPSVLDSSR